MRMFGWLPKKSACTIARCKATSLKNSKQRKLMRGKTCKAREQREKENKMKVLDSRQKAGGELGSFETDPF